MRSVVFPIIGINILVYLIQIMWEPFTGLFLLDQSKVLMEPYRLLTSMFMHGSNSHIAFNMFGLLIFGPILEQIIGPKRFLYTYIGSGLFAGIVAAFLYPLALGASGAIFGMLGVLIMLLPNLKILLFFIIPMPLWMAGVLWVGIDVFGLFNPGSVANAAHLAGIAAGFGYGYYLKHPKLRPRRKKPQTKIMTGDIELSDEDIEQFKRTGRI
ncbi:MAG: rhomboid family intramembrane serine protease [Candidatus Woesearchaeota archaeon]